MDNFDLKKYLAEGRLLKETFVKLSDEQKKKVKDAAKRGEAPEDVIDSDFGGDDKYLQSVKALMDKLAEGKPLKENINFPELEDEFEGAMDAMVVEPEVYLQDIINASPEEIVSDDYYEVMNAVEQGVYSEDEAVELAKAWAKEKLSTLSEGRIFEAKTIEVDGLQMYTYSPFKDKSFGVDGDKEVPMKYAGEANNLDDIMKLVSRLPDTVKELEVPYDLYFGPSLQTFKYKTLTPPFNLNEIRDMVVKVVNEEIPTRMSKAYGTEKYAKTYTLKPVGKFYYNPENAARSNEEDTAIYRLNILTN